MAMRVWLYARLSNDDDPAQNSLQNQQEICRAFAEKRGDNEFAEKLGEADGFVFSSPVHYAAASGNMTSFLDRLFYSVGGKLVGKPAAVVVSARRGGTTAAYEQLLKYPGICQMPIISSCYWNMVHGSCAEEVEQDLEGLRTMRVLGHNMAYFLHCLAAGRAAGIPLPPEEPPARTNFIR